MAALPLLERLARRPANAWCRTALARGTGLQEVVDRIARELGRCGPADLALVFASASFASDLPRLLPLLRQRLRAEHWLGCLGGGVIGCDSDGAPHELEQEPALSVTLLKLPGAQIHPFVLDAGELPDLDGPAEPWQARVGCGSSGMHSMLLLVDPTCPGLNDLIGGLDYAYPEATKVGGLAAAHSAPHGSLLAGERVHAGAVGCLMSGSWGLDAVVAQGCKPIGPILEVEQAERNVVLEVSTPERRSTPVAALQAILSHLSPQEREQVRHALFLGVGQSNFSLAAPSEHAFLVRNLIGVDPRNGAVAVAERMRVGQQVQFQLRDGEASRAELHALLEQQHGRQSTPLAALLFACLGRGEGLHGCSDGDVEPCRTRFPQVPIAGAFCQGEIGPVAGSTHLHGYTASWGFVVPKG
ncbi:MAG: FIST N-terminal domain-containing protein [Cyanobacteriota bacterium]|nr:FIST N-terminal domain-containing protein [Cyanobacteriota bacterium]